MLQLVSRLVLPFAVLISVYLYLRGHNLPGGGFIAGLVLAIGLLLQHMAHGQAWVQRSARWEATTAPGSAGAC
jgi:multicomponent K+:H+ antiporter subunit A